MFYISYEGLRSRLYQLQNDMVMLNGQVIDIMCMYVYTYICMYATMHVCMHVYNACIYLCVSLQDPLSSKGLRHESIKRPKKTG